MPTLVTKTVKSAGGDYSSLSLWEAGQQADLVTLDQVRQAECYAFSDTTATTVAGWTTDATRYPWITVAVGNRHTGAWSDSAYRMTMTQNTALALNNDYVLVEWVQFQLTTTTASTFNLCQANDSANHTLWRKCIFRENPAAVNVGAMKGIRQIGTTASRVLYVQNCIFYNMSTVSNSMAIEGANVASNSRIYAYNCIAYSCRIGFSGSVVVKNCIARLCGDGYQTSTAGSVTCVSDIVGDAPSGTGHQTSAVPSMVDPTNGNFRLNNSDTVAKGMGTDLSADATKAFSDDMDGDTRTAPWDIGPFIVDAPPAPTTKPWHYAFAQGLR